MKYPPYTYRPEFLFHDAKGDDVKRVASVAERERLMGHPTGYTWKEAETEAGRGKQTVAREAAIGNSFHTVVVACLLDLWLWKKQARTDPKAIVERWREEMSERSFDDVGEKDDATTHISMSERDKEEEEAIFQLMKHPKKEEMAAIGWP